MAFLCHVLFLFSFTVTSFMQVGNSCKTSPKTVCAINSNLTQIPDFNNVTVVLVDVTGNLIDDVIDFPVTSELTYLVLNKNLLTEFPDVTNAVNLGFLYLSKNKIAVIDPARLGGLKNLQRLHLNNNLITQIKSDAALGKLDLLASTKNKMTLCPDVKTLFPNLEQLYLSDNDIGVIADNCLGSLTKLSVAINDVIDFPDVTSLKMTLRELNLEKNELTTIHESVLELRVLETLRLAGNQIKAPPILISLPVTLVTMSLHDNPISCLDTQVKWLNALSHGDRK